MKRLIIFFAVFVFFTARIQAAIVLPAIFSDNMVLQRNALIPVWGQATPNEKITVQFDRQTKMTKADKTGKWIVRLDPESAGGPFELVIRGNNTLVIRNVLVGEVWICSGQSNMEWKVGMSLNAKQETENADYPFIRHIKIPKTISSLPKKDFPATSWQICDPATVGEFTAVGYFFARNIYKELKIPIGLINASWGGTNIETWISREAFEGSSEFREMIAGMPRVDLDSLGQMKIQGTERRLEALQGNKLKDLHTENFKLLIFDDAAWPVINQPQLWEQQSLGELDGVVWLRKSFILPPGEYQNGGVLELAKIDDDDITWVNGVKVGSTNQWDARRKYTIPAGVLKEGQNLITVRVVDNGGGGGIYGDSADVKITTGSAVQSLAGNWKCQVESVKKATNENSLPSLCYNAMISPLIPYAFRGVLWYQGESNAGRAWQYRKAFPLLISDWRQKWGQPQMPFYYVQLATFSTSGNSNEGCGWAELREAQALALELPFTGMCVTTDIGNPRDIHPVNKQEVGKRLAALAFNNDYSKPMVCSGPVYHSMEIKGDQIILSFDQTGSGLFTPDKYGYLRGFEIAGADQVFYFAKAVIKGSQVIVSCDDVKLPVAVHFGWAGDASECNLYNKDGFPAVPFRTDDWKSVTSSEVYKIEKLQ